MSSTHGPHQGQARHARMHTHAHTLWICGYCNTGHTTVVHAYPFYPFRYTPYGTAKCMVCKSAIYKADHKYCHTCAYQKGVFAWLCVRAHMCMGEGERFPLQGQVGCDAV